MEIPSGIISNNAILNNLGPKIPVRLSLSGELESYVSTNAENYGINNAIIKISVNIKVSEQIILPITTKKITIENTIPNNAIILFFWLYFLVLSINFSSKSLRDIKECRHILSTLLSMIELNNLENLNRTTNNTVIIR